jgi:hypothetical protein
MRIARKKKEMEFLTTLNTKVPDGTADAIVVYTRSREALRAQYWLGRVPFSGCGGLHGRTRRGDRSGERRRRSLSA